MLFSFFYDSGSQQRRMEGKISDFVPRETFVMSGENLALTKWEGCVATGI